MTTKVGKNLRNIYDSVADMVDNCKAKVGEKVETLGYYAPNDGGGAEYVVVEGGTGTVRGTLQTLIGFKYHRKTIR